MAREKSVSDHLPLHPIALRILLSVWDEPGYGTRIVEELDARSPGGPTLYPANLFRRIRDLLADGLLAEAPAPSGADPRRTYVRVTELGRVVARAEVARLRKLVAEAEAHGILADV